MYLISFFQDKTSCLHSIRSITNHHHSACHSKGQYELQSFQLKIIRICLQVQRGFVSRNFVYKCVGRQPSVQSPFEFSLITCNSTMQILGKATAVQLLKNSWTFTELWSSREHFSLLTISIMSEMSHMIHFNNILQYTLVCLLHVFQPKL